MPFLYFLTTYLLNKDRIALGTTETNMKTTGEIWVKESISKMSTGDQKNKLEGVGETKHVSTARGNTYSKTSEESDCILGD